MENPIQKSLNVCTPYQSLHPQWKHSKTFVLSNIFLFLVHTEVHFQKFHVEGYRFFGYSLCGEATSRPYRGSPSLLHYIVHVSPKQKFAFSNESIYPCRSSLRDKSILVVCGTGLTLYNFPWCQYMTKLNIITLQ